MMLPRSISLLALFLAENALVRFLRPVTSLPLRSRSGVRREATSLGSSDSGAFQERGATAVLSKRGLYEVDLSSDPDSDLRRNAIVEAFFLGDSSSHALQEEIHSQASNLTEFLLTTRRALHQHPELMYNEKETSGYIQAVLDDLDITYSTGWGVNVHTDSIPGKGGYGIVADIGTGEEPCILLRADIDGLSIVEETEGIEEFRSLNQGRMHACGHDGHATMLLGAAAVLKSMEGSINGTVRLMFQPAEEGGAGAKQMIDEGVLSLAPQPRHAFGMHLWPTLPSGAIASRAGPMMAAAEDFEIMIEGIGGHAGMPHMTVDPVVAASSIVMNFQTIVSRHISPLESGVVSVTSFQAGTGAFNIVPAATTLRGTIRAFHTETLMTLKKRVEHVATTAAGVHGCTVSIKYSSQYYPATINDPELFYTFSKEVAGLIAESGQVTDTEPSMGAEDFSFLAEAIPSTFFFLGQGSGEFPKTSYGLHHPQFAVDESVLCRGVELHVNLALRALKRLGLNAETEMLEKV